MISCYYLYSNFINKLEKNYNIFIIQQLLLIERGDTLSSQSLMSSYVRNALISINKNNEFSNYDNLCSNWKQLQDIILKHTKLNINNRYLSLMEKELIEKRKYDFNQVSENIEKYCKSIGGR